MKFRKVYYFLPLVFSLFQLPILVEAKSINEPHWMKRQQLMASHLLPPMRTKLINYKNLTYTTGHEFYDTPIELIDENGNTLKYREDIKPKRHYQIKQVGHPKLVSKSIWFFRPGGSTEEVNSDNIWTSCTAEYPCQEITQSIVDNIPPYNKPQLWIAPGDYQMPFDKHQNQALLSLKNKMALIGRSTDFRFIAYDNDRPLLEGALIWNDYTGHTGSDGSIENVRVKTGDAPIQVLNDFANINLFSTRSLTLVNVDLEKKHQSNGENIQAELVSVYDSNLSVEGEMSNNISAEYLLMRGSVLNVKGEYTRNLIINNGLVSVSDSKLQTLAESCYSTAIEVSDVMAITLRDSSIVMESKSDCPQLAPPLRGLINYQIDNTPYPHSQNVDLGNLELKIKATDASVVGIETSTDSLSFNKVNFNLESLKGKVYAIDNSKPAELTFHSQASLIWIKSPIFAAMHADSAPLKINNNSTSLSQCKYNQQAAVNC
ncbi:MAG: hypothetical protein EPN84_01890 [Legionella sp.]|nr:MAG: hypothetical protein EPN84_01890 [Legionella sp.]